MSVVKKIVQKSMSDYKVKAFIGKQVEKAGVSSVTIQKTPLATRIILAVRRPGIVVGKKGHSIKELCDELEAKFGVENPQIDVMEVSRPELDAVIMAEKIAKQIEVRMNSKQIVRMTLKDIMNAGAVGAEIRISGKITGKGDKARTMKIRDGYLKKSGSIMGKVLIGRYQARLRGGIVGVTVRIVPPEVVFQDKIDYKKIPFDEVQAEGAKEAVAEPVAPAAEKVQEVIEDGGSEAKGSA
jgi:small subunit ribosomal protein S3